ncbi:MAG: ATP synthase F1 subunit delta [Cyanobacteria bacterium REEB67]|nr:ATP synthase F1 subunit delta [Cyanobacteria bacterium REEB67]
MNTELQGIASKYAEAVLDLAVSARQEEQMLNELKLIADVIASDRDMTIIINHPSIDSTEKKRFLSSLFQGKISELADNLIGLLADKRRLNLIPFIESNYRELLNQRKNILSASLSCSEPLADSAIANIKAQLAEHLGKTLELEVKVDPSLIGGLVLKMGDQVIDGSLKGQLRSLEKTLLSV